MPEGPEVRRYADLLDVALRDKPLVAVSARTKAAKAWLEAHPDELVGRRVQSVRAHGKNLIGLVEDGTFFYSHLMMWGRWQIVPREEAGERDRRERARLETQEHAAILLSAPVFEIGRGEPYEQVEYLRALGPDTLPYADAPPFDAPEFLRRLNLPEHAERGIGAALLDQEILAGIGNYLRAEILFECRLDPFRRVCRLTPEDLASLCRVIPTMALRAYETGGATLPEAARERARSDAALVYRPEGSDYGKRHYVFRRTNLPCLECHTPVRQLRQVTRQMEDEDKTRIIYFCPQCQGVEVQPAKKRKPKAATNEP